MKITIIVIAAFLGGLALAGCGSSGQGTASPPSSPGHTASASATQAPSATASPTPSPSPTPTPTLFVSAAQAERLAIGTHIGPYTVTSASVTEGPDLSLDGRSESGQMDIQTNTVTTGALTGSISGSMYFRVFKDKPKYIALCSQLSSCTES